MHLGFCKVSSSESGIYTYQEGECKFLVGSFPAQQMAVNSLGSPTLCSPPN